MKHLRDYITEELTTSTNTIGMGDPVLPSETTTGSGDQLSSDSIKKTRSNKRTSKNKKLRKVYK